MTDIGPDLGPAPGEPPPDSADAPDTAAAPAGEGTGPGTDPVAHPRAGGSDSTREPAESRIVDAAVREIETELTFEVPRRWSLPALAGVGGVAVVESARRISHTATYLDTINLDLLRNKNTLRRRVGGHDAGWHLKQPRGSDSRLEIREGLGRPGMVPVSLRAAVSGLTGGQALVPVAVLRNRRLERQLLDGDGQVLATLTDDTVEATVLLTGERVYRWREIEAELGPAGTTDVYESITAALLKSGLVVSAHQSKLGRALEPDLRRLDDAANREPTAGDVALRYVSSQVGALQSLEAAVRADEPDAVHKARVATRRLRSALRTFALVLESTVSDPLRAEVAWLTGVLGAPRDAEVLRDHFRELTGDLEPDLTVGPAVERILTTMNREHGSAHAALVKALDSRRYERLMSDLADLVTTPASGPGAGELARDRLPAAVEKASAAVAKAAQRAASSADPHVRDDAIHGVRKRAKAARYAAEVVGDVLGRRARKLVDAWTDVQEVLGDYQDSVIARQALDRICAQARRAKEDTFTYGVLVEREAARARRLQEQYPALLESARAAAQRLAEPAPPAKKPGVKPPATKPRTPKPRAAKTPGAKKK